VESQSQNQPPSQPVFNATTQDGTPIAFGADGSIIDLSKPVAEPEPVTAPVLTEPAPVQAPVIDDRDDRIRLLEEENNKYKSSPFIGVLQDFETNPESAAELLNLISTDFDRVSEVELYKQGWIEQNSYPGADYADLLSDYEYHLQNDLIGFDPNSPKESLGPDYGKFKRVVETTRAANKETQAGAREELSKFKSANQNQSTNGYQDTPEQRAEVAKFYTEQIEKLNIDYTTAGIPPEVAKLLDATLPQQYKAKLIAEVSDKPFLGLEGYFAKTESGAEVLDVNKLAGDRFKLDNFNSIIEKAIAYGDSRGRAYMSKEMENAMHNPGPGHTPGGSASTPKTVNILGANLPL